MNRSDSKADSIRIEIHNSPTGHKQVFCAHWRIKWYYNWLCVTGRQVSVVEAFNKRKNWNQISTPFVVYHFCHILKIVLWLNLNNQKYVCYYKSCFASNKVRKENCYIFFISHIFIFLYFHIFVFLYFCYFFLFSSFYIVIFFFIFYIWKIAAGVPQRNVLGPVLYTLFTADISVKAQS